MGRRQVYLIPPRMGMEYQKPYLLRMRMGMGFERRRRGQETHICLHPAPLSCLLFSGVKVGRLNSSKLVHHKLAWLTTRLMGVK